MASIVLLLPIVLALLAAAGIAFLQRADVRPARTWTAAALAHLLIWVTVGASATRLPSALRGSISVFLPGASSEVDWLILDTTTWPLGLALVTLILAVQMTSLIQLERIDPGALLGWCLLSAAGLLAVFSGTVVVMLMSWVLLDAVSLWLGLRGQKELRGRQRTLRGFGGSLMGTLLLLAATVYWQNPSVSLQAVPGEALPILLLAAFWRLVISPLLTTPAEVSLEQPRTAATAGLVQAGGTLVMLVHAASTGPGGRWLTAVLAAAAFMGLYSGLRWIGAAHAAGAQPFWTSALGALAIAAAMLGFPEAAGAIGVGLVLGGAVFFYRVPSGGSTPWLVFTAVVLLSGLPFTPLWASAGLIESGLWPWGWLWGLILALILIGCVKFGLTVRRGAGRQTAGVQAVYLTGMLLPLAGMIYATWPYLRGGFEAERAWWGGGLVLLISAGWYTLTQSTRTAGLSRFESLSLDRPFAWILRRFGTVLGLTGRGAAYMARLFEGDGSLLWALVLLALVITIFVQLGLGL